MNQVYNTLNRITGAHLDPIYAEPLPGEQRRSSISAAKIKAELGVEISTPLEEGLKETAAWFKG